MIVSRNPTGKKIDIEVDGQYLEQIEKSEYLGTLVMGEIKIDIQLETRSYFVKNKFSEMLKILT